MTSKQQQHEIDTTVEALQKRRQQVRKAIDRGYFSSTPEGQQLTRDVFLGYSKAVEDHITRLVGRSGRFASAAAHHYFAFSTGDGLIISSFRNPATPATNGIVIPATASKAMA